MFGSWHGLKSPVGWGGGTWRGALAFERGGDARRLRGVNLEFGLT